MLDRTYSLKSQSAQHSTSRTFPPTKANLPSGKAPNLSWPNHSASTRLAVPHKHSYKTLDWLTKFLLSPYIEGLGRGMHLLRVHSFIDLDTRAPNKGQIPQNQGLVCPLSPNDKLETGVFYIACTLVSHLFLSISLFSPLPLSLCLPLSSSLAHLSPCKLSLSRVVLAWPGAFRNQSALLYSTLLACRPHHATRSPPPPFRSFAESIWSLWNHI